MRRVTSILSVVVAVVLMAAGLVAQATPSIVAQAKPSFVDQAKPSFADQAKPSFAGEWKLDVPMGQGEPGVDLTITQTATAVNMEFRASRQGPTPGKFTYKLDGSVNQRMMPGPGGAAPIEQVSKAMWAGNNLVVTTTTGTGDEKRTFTTDGVYLVVETSAPAPNGGAPTVTKVTYQRYVHGFGG